jgi:nickel transport protein
MRTAALILAALLAVPALAHDVSHRVGTALAVTVALSYGDGKPFAYEAYELFPDGADVPAQVGRTDGQGRVVFVPGEHRKWRLRAFSGDGHGADFRFESPERGSASSSADAVWLDRPAMAALGLGLILAGFGIWQLFLRRRRAR